MDKVSKSDQEWRAQLTAKQYRILRAASTEQAFTGQYVDTEDEGMYVCAACRYKLFSSGTKFHSGSGWPRFWDVISQGDIELRDDTSHGMQRVEIVSEGHLGHLFEDGPRDKTGLRCCVNSAALDFVAEENG